MLSYRHGFHAGNHADVLKHWVVCLISDYMGQKDKPYWYIDTHAASGGYSLSSADAQKTGESDTGIKKLWKQDTPEVLHGYLSQVKRFNTSGDLEAYPGSPWFAHQYMREQDKARFFELHPQDFASLKQIFGKDKAIKVAKEDGLAGLKALLPPPTKRAFTVIDPPYELPKEYDEIPKVVEASYKRFSTGVYMIWYPLINRNSKQKSSERMVEKLKRLKVSSAMDIRLWVSGDNEESGMYGSGLYVINPPWTLKEQLEKGLPYLVKCLGQPAGAGYKVEVVAG